MGKIMPAVGAVMLVLVTAILANTPNQITVKTMPPVVVKTVPQAGDISVNPALNEISVTFSKPMTPQMWSCINVSDDTFPQITGEIKYLEDKRTCVMPVKLEPDKTYALWLNLGKLDKFRDEDNQPAVPYLLVFQTAADRPPEK